jgi:glycosyltransferase involved in cell wall biosynthesis
MKVSVVIPVFNEARTIAEIVRRVTESEMAPEIIVVDDGSSDGTREVLSSIPGITLLFHDRNCGKGAAIRTALDYVTGDIVIVQDADLEYDPRDYPLLLAPILQGDADVVYGSRFLGGPHRVLFFWHFLANQLLTLLSNVLTNLNLTDMETGYKAFRAHILQKINLQSDRFGFEPEITAKIARRGCRIYEVPISYRGRDYAAGKKITWRDGVAALYHILRYNLFKDVGKKKTVPHRAIRKSGPSALSDRWRVEGRSASVIPLPQQREH